MGIIKKALSHLDVAEIFIILSIVNFKNFFLSCVNYQNLGFDSQIPLTWDFTSLSNFLPYKDIYFPYGLLFYLKNTVPLFSIIYFLLPVLIFVGIYIVFKYLFKNKLIAFASFISFYLFINKYTGMESFARYGIVLGAVLFLSYVFYKRQLISVKVSVLLGILIGVIFSLVNDQGIYILLLYIFLLVLTYFLNKSKNTYYINFFASRLLAVGFGFVLGFLPLLIFLNIHNLTDKFFLFLFQLSDFPLYAKTPFIPFSTTVDNLFTFAAIFITLVALSYKIFFGRVKISFVTILELCLVFVLFMLEQKSIIRSIDKQITFLAFFLYIVLFYDLLKNTLNSFFLLLCFLLISVLIQLGVGLHPFINYRLTFNQGLVNSFFIKNIDDFLHDKSKFCLSNNINSLVKRNDVVFEKARALIQSDSKGGPKIFNYLSDPIFYVLFNQKPPYYFTVFEATPLYAQKSNIKYIEQNNVNYIIKNTGLQMIEDGVPDSIRNKNLFKYVESNFKVLDRINNFIIYKKI